MDKEQLESLLEKQREFFATGVTKNVDYRINALKRLYDAVRKNENRIDEALREDLGKGRMESFMCEVGLSLSEISHMIKHVKKYASDRTVATPITCFHSHSYVKPCPKGNILIMSPWNYPFLLSIDPLADALAAGNTVILKVSAYSKATSEVIKEILGEVFDEEYVAVVTGGRGENSSLLSLKFDHIFFTGSQAVGREVMRKAAEHLTPVTLELGGKSPCIVDETANIKLTARRLVFAKFMNCGQTCVAPDYVICHEDVKEDFIDAVKKEITRQFGKDPLKNKNYGRIINKKHYQRLEGLMDESRIVSGGRRDPKTLKIEPTIMDGVTMQDAVMKEEIFGPIIPVMTYRNLDEVIRKLDRGAHPLALYIFSESRDNTDRITSGVRYGGGCINDALVHLATSSMPFGGFGESGMGAYHGKSGFDTFTHYKSVMDKKEWIDVPMRYQPYRRINEKIMRLFLK